jgi:hypothetical protein
LCGLDADRTDSSAASITVETRTLLRRQAVEPAQRANSSEERSPICSTEFDIGRIHSGRQVVWPAHRKTR